MCNGQGGTLRRKTNSTNSLNVAAGSAKSGMHCLKQRRATWMKNPVTPMNCLLLLWMAGSTGLVLQKAKLLPSSKALVASNSNVCCALESGDLIIVHVKVGKCWSLPVYKNKFERWPSALRKHVGDLEQLEFAPACYLPRSEDFEVAVSKIRFTMRRVNMISSWTMKKRGWPPLIAEGSLLPWNGKCLLLLWPLVTVV